MENQKFHHPGQIMLLWDYDDSVLNYHVIRLLFQPLLENSIHYSIRCPSDSLVIRIKIFEKGEVLIPRICHYDSCFADRYSVLQKDFFIYPIRTFFPSNANPYFLIRSAAIPFTSSTDEYRFSSI